MSRRAPCDSDRVGLSAPAAGAEQEESDEVVALRLELAEQRRRLETLHLSTSWRITAPLRAAGRLCRRGLDRLAPRPGTVVWRALRRAFHSLPLRAATKARWIGYLVSRGFLRALPAGGVPTRRRPEVTRAQQPWPADRPLVSVVIPCFNYAHFVPTAVSSVLAQTFQDLEILVVDGGSTDEENRRLLTGMSWPKTEIHLRPERHLVGDNRNYGIARARGRYICCVDADDRLQPTYLEKALFLLETQGYDVVSTAIQSFGGRSEVYSVMRHPSLADVAHSNQVSTCAVFRRELWERAGGFVDSGLGADYVYEDWRLWVRFAALGARIANLVEEPLFLYRVHAQSLSRQSEMASIDQHRAAIAEGNQDLLTPEAYRASEVERELRVRMDDPWLNLRSRGERKGGPTVLLVVPFLIVGGAERLLSSVARELQGRGYRLILVSTVYVDASFGDCSDWFEEATSEIYHLPRFLEPELWRDFLFTQIETKGVDLLWVVGSAFLYDLLPEIKEAYPALKVVDLLFNTVVHARSNRKRSRQIDLTLVENREVYDWLLQHKEKPGRMRLIESGVDLEVCKPKSGKAADVLARLGIPADVFVVGFSGRLSEEKSPETFLNLAHHLRDDARFHFVMTGAGPLAEEVRRESARLGLGPRFQFLGRVEDVHEILGLYDALILPSRFDGRPVVVLESLAMGVPVVASSVGALPELVREGETGFLCRPGDVRGFADRLRWLATHPEDHGRMRTAARAFAERHFDARRMVDAYEQALRELTPRRPG